jgi:hypothetical protein
LRVHRSKQVLTGGDIKFPTLVVGEVKATPASWTGGANDETDGLRFKAKILEAVTREPPAQVAPSSDCPDISSSVGVKLTELVAAKQQGPIAWTVIGGAYNDMFGEVQRMADRTELGRVLFVCLDQAAVEVACAAGYSAVLYQCDDCDKLLVALAKFEVAKRMLAVGLDFIFFECDVFLLRSPKRILAESEADIQVPVQYPVHSKFVSGTPTIYLTFLIP